MSECLSALVTVNLNTQISEVLHYPDLNSLIYGKITLWHRVQVSVSSYLDPILSLMRSCRRKLMQLSALPAFCWNRWFSWNYYFHLISRNGDTLHKFKEITGRICTTLLLRGKKKRLFNNNEKRKVIKKGVLLSWLVCYELYKIFRFFPAVWILLLLAAPEYLPS